MSELQCIVVTPEKPLVDESAEFVALPLYDGEIGIAPGHTPLIGRLGAGELRITQRGSVSRYYVESGFVEVVDNVVTLLTSRAVPTADLDAAVAEEQLATARARAANTPELMAQRDRAVAVSRAQLRVARRAK
ncbi:MAG: ATP synthase F1 subunit epsilon [Planctomycetota bacterium]|jgi:F-type H+-transporting ATPase subunit epsilon